MQALLSETESSKNEPRNSNQNWYYQISPNRGKIKHQILDSNQKKLSFWNSNAADEIWIGNDWSWFNNSQAIQPKEDSPRGAKAPKTKHTQNPNAIFYF